jgi:hypothetical protein
VSPFFRPEQWNVGMIENSNPFGIMEEWNTGILGIRKSVF